MNSVVILGSVLIILITVGVFAAFRGGSQKKGIDFIAEYQFPDVVLNTLKRDHPEWDEKTIGLAWLGLKEYFMAHVQAKSVFNYSQVLGMPSYIADEAWHAFVVCTKDYSDFCESAFGKMLHHEPDIEAKPCAIVDAAQINKASRVTFFAAKKLYERHPDAIQKIRKIAPDTGYLDMVSVGLPLLFLIDSNSAHATTTGWPYSLTALKQLDILELDDVVKGTASHGNSNSSGACGGLVNGTDVGHSCSGHSCSSSSSCSGGGCGGH